MKKLKSGKIENCNELWIYAPKIQSKILSFFDKSHLKFRAKILDFQILKFKIFAPNILQIIEFSGERKVNLNFRAKNYHYHKVCLCRKCLWSRSLIVWVWDAAFFGNRTQGFAASRHRFIVRTGVELHSGRLGTSRWGTSYTEKNIINYGQDGQKIHNIEEVLQYTLWQN